MVASTAGSAEGTAREGRRYRIEGVLGKGGFGTVYKAELIGSAGFSKAVALKVLNPDVADVAEVAQRLRDEARILGLVRHRAIVVVDGLVMVEGRWAVVMEYVEGVDLKTLLKRGPMPLGPALELGAEVASALRVALDQPGTDGQPLGMLHRDIKPSNLQLTAAGEVKILDFGTARAQFGAREAHTRSLAFGTLEYMSPERLDFHDMPAGDVYALGAVLFEAILGVQVGRTSPREDRHAEVMSLAMSLLTDYRGPPELNQLLADMLAWAPERRPTIHEVERRLRRLRGNLDEPWLAEWAGRVVPPLMAARGELDVGELSGAIVVESSGSRLMDPAPEEPVDTSFVRVPVPTPPGAEIPPAAPAPPPPTRSRRWIPALVGAGLFVALAATFLGWLALREPAPPPEEVAAEIVAPPAVEPPSIEAEEVLAEPPEAPSPPVQAAPTAPREAPKAARPAATGRLIVAGDASQVRLVGPAGRFSAGAVPVGRYRIEATFPDRGKVLAGETEIRAGQTVTITCHAAFARCVSG